MERAVANKVSRYFPQEPRPRALIEDFWALPNDYESLQLLLNRVEAGFLQRNRALFGSVRSCNQMAKVIPDDNRHLLILDGFLMQNRLPVTIIPSVRAEHITLAGHVARAVNLLVESRDYLREVVREVSEKEELIPTHSWANSRAQGGTMLKVLPLAMIGFSLAEICTLLRKNYYAVTSSEYQLRKLGLLNFRRSFLKTP